ncbi:MAG: hypothetical protein HFH11_05945 [Dorea sp.]|nr:hypothetical protein [Dorea sp.]
MNNLQGMEAENLPLPLSGQAACVHRWEAVGAAELCPEDGQGRYYLYPCNRAEKDGRRGMKRKYIAAILIFGTVGYPAWRRGCR